MPISRVGRRRPHPQAVDERASVGGLRALATFEAVKGVIVLLLGLGILGLLHKDVEAAAESLLLHLHINPDSPAVARIYQRGYTYDRCGPLGDFFRLGRIRRRAVYRGVGAMEQACVGRMVRIAFRCVISAVGNVQTHATAQPVAFNRVPAKYSDPALSTSGSPHTEV